MSSHDHLQNEELLTSERTLLEKADEAYGDQEIFRPERSRVAYKQWKLAIAQGVGNAEKFAEKALELFYGPQRKARRIDELADSDFDEQIMFWSR